MTEFGPYNEKNRQLYEYAKKLGKVCAAVSYTHLDVYKRQGYMGLYAQGKRETGANPVRTRHCD